MLDKVNVSSSFSFRSYSSQGGISENDVPIPLKIFPTAYISGRRITRTQPVYEYKIHVIGLSSDERHNLQLNPSFIPCPQFDSKFSYSFQLPIECQIL